MTRTSSALRSAPDTSDAAILTSVVAGLHVPARIVLPTSWIGHIPFASWIVSTARPDTVVELGVHTGNSFFTFAEAAARSDLPTKLYGVDTWAGDEHAGAYAEDVFVDISGVARSRFPDSVVLVRKLFADAVDDFGDGSIDLLHIDGLHTYEAVREDFETWKPKLSRRAIVLFHDIVVTREGFGVDRFWAEITTRYPHVAFTHSNGLGMLLVGPDVPTAVMQLALSPTLGMAFTSLFAKLGDFLAQSIVHGPDVDALPMNPQVDPPRIYLGRNGEFTEDNAIDARPVSGSPGALAAAFAPIDDVDSISLRIDPMHEIGLRGIHRVLVAAEGQVAPVQIIPGRMDSTARLSIVPVDEGFIFVCTDGDSQWTPALSAEARDVFRHGARIIFEPIAAPTASLTRILLRALRTLVGPLDERLAEMRVLEESQRQNGVVLHEAIDALNARLQELGVRLHESETAKAASEAGRLEALQAAEAVRAEDVTLRDELVRTSAAFDALRTEHAALAASNARLQDVDARLLEVNARLDESETAKVASDTGRLEAQRASDAAQAEVVALRDEIVALSDEVVRTSTALDALRTEHDALAASNARLQDVDARLRESETAKVVSESGRLAALRAAEAAQAEVVTLRDELVTLRDEHVRMSTGLDALRTQYAALEASNATSDLLLSEYASMRVASPNFRTQFDAVATAVLDPSHHGSADATVFTNQAVAGLAAESDPVASSIGTVIQRLLHSRELARGQLLVTNSRPRGLATRLSDIAIGDRIALPLVPLKGVIPLDAAARRWHAVDNDPQFDFNDLCRFAGHWVQLETDLDVEWRPDGNPVIYLDTGSGYSEAGTLVLPQSALASKLLPLIFAVPLDLRSARFDPCSLPLPFGFHAITLTVLSKWQAMYRMAKTMRHTGRLRQLKDTYLPRWKTMRSSDGRRQLKHAFIQSYRETLYRTAPSYHSWISRFEPSLKAYSALSAERTLWPRHPVISVLMPTYNTPEKFLTDAIESVMAQQYPHWELCIADDASQPKHVGQILKDFAKRDRRIRIAFREQNGHISAASNSALELATGEFIALLDHDDALHPLALHYVADAIIRNPSAKLIFSDEDKLDASGARHTPYFKCDFNPDLFLAQNMITHLGCYRTETVREVGGFRLGLEGSQDWDLALRVYEQADAKEIIHIPRVLYHWRELPGSTALSIDEKPYAQNAGRRAVADHLARRGIDAVALPAPLLPLWNRIRYAVPTPPPKVSIVIPTRDKVEVLKTAVDSVLELTTYPNFEIVIVDNGSVETATATYLSSLAPDRVRVLRDDSPFNYSRINNRAVAQSNGEFVCLLNNDIEVLNGDWLDEMVSIGSQPQVGIVGARLWYPDHRIQHAGVILGIGGVAGHAHKLMPKGHVGYFGRAALQQQLSAVTGACLLISRAIWDEMGGLDENLSVAFNDVDLCMRVGAAGHRVVWTPFAEMIHYESISRGAEDTPEKVTRFNAEADLMRARWGDKLVHDPFYSPNLTLVAEDFSISWQPQSA